MGFNSNMGNMISYGGNDSYNDRSYGGRRVNNQRANQFSEARGLGIPQHESRGLAQPDVYDHSRRGHFIPEARRD